MGISKATVVRLILQYIGGTPLMPIKKVEMQSSTPVVQMGGLGGAISSINGIALSAGLQSQISSFISQVSNPGAVLQDALTDALQQVFRNPLSDSTIPIVTSLPVAAQSATALFASINNDPSAATNLTTSLGSELATNFITAVNNLNQGLGTDGSLSTALQSFVAHTNNITGGGVPAEDDVSFGLREISAMQKINPSFNIQAVTSAISESGAAAASAAQTTLVSAVQQLQQFQLPNGTFDYSLVTPETAAAIISATESLTTTSSQLSSFVTADQSTFSNAINEGPAGVTNEIASTLSEIAGQFATMSPDLKKLVLDNMSGEAKALLDAITGELGSFSAGDDKIYISE